MRRNRVSVSCHHCSTIVEVIKARENTFMYCSKSCHGKAVLATLDRKTIPKACGEKNHNWKGGRRKHTNGYVWVLVDKKYILEHRHIMQQHLGRALVKGEQVHHKNGNKLDNRIENLELMNISTHTKKHHEEGKFKPIGQWAKKYTCCGFCGTTTAIHWAKGLCRKCYRKLCNK